MVRKIITSLYLLADLGHHSTSKIITFPVMGNNRLIFLYLATLN